MTDLPGDSNALFAPFHGIPEGIGKEPILTVQHTRFACGGVSLGVRLLHTVCDAEGFFKLVRDLAELYRGLNDKDLAERVPSLAQPPQIRSYLTGLSDNITPEARQASLEFKPELFHLEAEVTPAEVEPEIGSTGPPPSVTPSAPTPSPPPPNKFSAPSSSGPSRKPCTPSLALPPQLLPPHCSKVSVGSLSSLIKARSEPSFAMVPEASWSASGTSLRSMKVRCLMRSQSWSRRHLRS
ncbi:hypothetical protein FRB94_012001 [Tulasnella sp. JGI-2019a]|nr:hypothetical protein FRB94_012001 [Tulasnella sp. JGI-2019a]